METLNELYGLTRQYISLKSYCLGEIGTVLQGYVRSRNYARLAQCASLFRDQALQSRDVHRALLQIEAFFKKNAALSDRALCRRSAYKQFLSSERDCRWTNARIDDSRFESTEPYPGFGYDRERVMKRLASVLGPRIGFSEEVIENVKVTTGATYDLPHHVAGGPGRLRGRMTVTPRARPLVAAISEYLGYSLKLKDVLWNRVTFVPKNFKTERTIACEPTCNVAIQLTLDKYIKGRLKRYGIDLSSQKKNQELAFLGSIGGGFATIDLRAASDSFALNTLVDLFPQEWIELVMAVRSPCFELRTSTKTHRGVYAKVSSMGNGATFALETLFFEACCFAVGSRGHAVYGDDIVIDETVAPRLIRLLAHYGFSINVDKTFLAGPFRESCGVNYHDGVDITPFYVRDLGNRRRLLSLNWNGILRVTDGHPGIIEQAKRSIVKNKIRLVPYNLDPCSGVFITPHRAFASGILVHRQQRLWFRAHIESRPVGVCVSSRMRAIWYLRYCYDESSLEARERMASRYATGFSKSRQKYVGYHPIGGTPLYIHMYEEELFRLR